MDFRNTEIMNFEGAFRGLRNPLESWAKSDSQFGIDSFDYCTADFDVADRYCLKDGLSFDDIEKWDEAESKYVEWLNNNGVLKACDNYVEYAYIGPNDLNLAQRMIKAGTSDRKFMRQIFVSVDITAPIYWFKEFDTYKVGTVANSTSTMHKLSSTPITKKCFEMGDFNPSLVLYPPQKTKTDNVDSFTSEDLTNFLVDYCEQLRLKYLETKDKAYWKELIRWLPEGWLQTRTVTMNYEILRNMYFQRRYHKLTEWHEFCKWIESLPYANELICYES